MKPRTILIVEDDPDILFAMSMLLEGEGYIIQKAGNGALAMDLLDEHGLPDLILLDMMMPVMDGWQFARKFREKFQTLLPIVIMSAAADAEERAQAIGADAWIGKPFMMEELLPILRKHEKGN